MEGGVQSDIECITQRKGGRQRIGLFKELLLKCLHFFADEIENQTV